jgi:hypothetical protein
MITVRERVICVWTHSLAGLYGSSSLSGNEGDTTEDMGEFFTRQFYQRIRLAVIQGIGRGAGAWGVKLFSAVWWAALMSALTFVGGIIEQLPWTVIFVLTVAMFVLIMVAANTVWSWQFKTQWRKRSNRLYRQFENEWGQRVKCRETFWMNARAAFKKWDKKPPSVSEIESLIREAGCPGGLPPHGEDIRDFARRGIQEWEGVRRELLNFCLALYSQQENSLLLDQKELEEFDETRRNLSKFWDEWGKEGFFYNTVDIDALPELIPGQTSQILLLIYLEIARAERNRDEGPGKQWLFQLGQSLTRR